MTFLRKTPPKSFLGTWIEDIIVQALKSDACIDCKGNLSLHLGITYEIYDLLFWSHPTKMSDNQSTEHLFFLILL